jgi:hypothetical protein
MEPGQGELLGAAPPARRVGALDHIDDEAGAGQRHCGGESVGARAHHNGVGPSHSTSSRPSAAPHTGTGNEEKRSTSPSSASSVRSGR